MATSSEPGVGAGLTLLISEIRELVFRSTRFDESVSWGDGTLALRELDELLARIRSGPTPWPRLKLLFAPTGPLQELSLQNGWSDAFLGLAARFDELT